MRDAQWGSICCVSLSGQHRLAVAVTGNEEGMGLGPILGSLGPCQGKQGSAFWAGWGEHWVLPAV